MPRTFTRSLLPEARGEVCRTLHLSRPANAASPPPTVPPSDSGWQLDRIEDGVHHGLRLTTDGFTLEVGRARVTRTKELVSVFPLPEKSPGLKGRRK